MSSKTDGGVTRGGRPKNPDRFADWDDSTMRWTTRVTVDKYDPSQPRDPAGTDTGGQWTGGADGGPKSFTDRKAADEWGTSTQAWAKDLTQEQMDALDAYTVHVGVNETLRAGKVPNADTSIVGPGVYHVRVAGSSVDAPEWRTASEAQVIERLDSVFAKPEAVLQEDVVVHRAWSGRGTPSSKTEGSTFRDKGFTSTALVVDVIDVFRTDPNSGRQRGIDVEIHARKGTRAIFLGTKPEGAGWFADNTEVLINRGTRYRVLSVGEIKPTQADFDQWASNRTRGWNDPRPAPRKKLVLETIP